MAKGKKNIWDAVGKEDFKEQAKKSIETKTTKPKKRPGRKKLPEELIVVKAFKHTRTQLKVLAAEENITMAEKLAELVEVAYKKHKG